MTSPGIIHPVLSSIQHVLQNLPFFVSTLIFVIPLQIILDYFDIMLETKETTGEDNSFELMASLILLIPAFLIYTAYAYSWHKQFLTSEAVNHNPINLTSNYTLFLKKTLWITVITFFIGLLLILPGIAMAFMAITGSELMAAIGMLLMMVGMIIAMYWILPYWLALPAAALGQNIPIKEAKAHSKPHHFRFFLTTCFYGLIFIIVLLIFSFLLVGISTALFGVSFDELDITAQSLFRIPLNVVSLLFTAAYVGILCQYYTFLFKEN